MIGASWVAFGRKFRPCQMCLVSGLELIGCTPCRDPQDQLPERSESNSLSESDRQFPDPIVIVPRQKPAFGAEAD